MRRSGDYAHPKFETDRETLIGGEGGFSVPGTAAANVELARLRMLGNRVIDAAAVVGMTGGTADGPTIALQKSLGGTGDPVSFATHNFATAADNASAALTVTSTTFVAGDHLVLANLAGTAASTPVATLNFQWRSNFVG